MLGELCRVATRAVPGAEGASVTTFSDGKPSAVASDDWSKGFDELQYVEHEGPCLDAYRTGNVFRIRDLEAEPRWPFYCPKAVERGARSMISIPLAAEGLNVGALNLYSAKPDTFDSDAMSVATIVAAHVGLAIQVGAALFGHRDLHEQLSEAIKSRAVIEQAKGIVMAQQHCSADDAFNVLTTQSQNSNTKLRDVAAAVVAKAIGGGSTE
jgi:transcriptional regulator with GAF, ATPase, and Fis domain